MKPAHSSSLFDRLGSASVLAVVLAFQAGGVDGLTRYAGLLLALAVALYAPRDDR